jgi:hypothetical protein
MQLKDKQEEVYQRKKAIPVNVPTRFASNLFVANGIADSAQALIQMVGTEAWDNGPGKTASGEHIRDIILRDVPGLAHFWEDLARLIELLQPFSDAIHQLECDRPMLSQCHVVLVSLDKHVKAFSEKHKAVRDGSIVDRLTETFTRRLNTTPGSVRAPIYNPAYTAAFMTDPYYAVREDGKWRMPDVPDAQLPAVLALVSRVGVQRLSAASSLLSSVATPAACSRGLRQWRHRSSLSPMHTLLARSASVRKCRPWSRVGACGADLGVHTLSCRRQCCASWLAMRLPVPQSATGVCGAGCTPVLATLWVLSVQKS